MFVKVVGVGVCFVFLNFTIKITVLNHFNSISKKKNTHYFLKYIIPIIIVIFWPKLHILRYFISFVFIYYSKTFFFFLISINKITQIKNLLKNKKHTHQYLEIFKILIWIKFTTQKFSYNYNNINSKRKFKMKKLR